MVLRLMLALKVNAKYTVMDMIFQSVPIVGNTVPFELMGAFGVSAPWDPPRPGPRRWSRRCKCR